MSVTIASVPNYPVAGKPVKLRFLTSGGNYVRTFSTDAPPGSQIKKDLDKDALAQKQFYQGDADSDLLFTFDRGGVYVFQAHEITKGAAPHGGGYEDDPAGDRSESPIGINTATVTVGSRVTFDVAVGNLGNATLVLHVFGTTIRATTESLHGEKTPALINPTTAAAKTAVLSSTVQSALNAFQDQLATAIVGVASAALDDLIDSVNDHMSNTGGVWHASADSDNTIDVGFKGAATPAGLQRAVDEVYAKLGRHLNTDAGAGEGEMSGNYHSSVDWPAKLVATSAGSLGLALVRMADLWRAYEVHRANGAIHNIADTVNTLASLPPLLDFFRIFIETIATSSPAAPPTENVGKITLVHGGGFKEG